jgi:hypothetical protein
MVLVPRVVGLANVPEPSELVLQKTPLLLQEPVPPRALGLHHAFVKVCADEVSGSKTIEQTNAAAKTAANARNRPAVRNARSWGEPDEMLARDVAWCAEAKNGGGVAEGICFGDWGYRHFRNIYHWRKEKYGLMHVFL